MYGMSLKLRNVLAILVTLYCEKVLNHVNIPNASIHCMDFIFPFQMIHFFMDSIKNERFNMQADQLLRVSVVSFRLVTFIGQIKL